MSDTLITTLVTFIVAMIPIMSIIVKLNSTLTKLNLTINVLSKQMEYSNSDRKQIHETLNNHETRITVLEKGGKNK